jgi:hypothetical protein
MRGRGGTALALGLLVLGGLVPLSGLAPRAAADSIAAVGSLPSPRDAMSAASDGRYVYAFGGYSGGFLDDVVRVDSVTGEVRVMQAKLPTPRYWTSAVWAGDAAYVFGGYDGQHLRDILRYDPARDELRLLPARLPSPRVVTTAVWDGASAYILGGNDGLAAWRDDIVRFTPADGSVTTMQARLPSPRDAMAGVWDGQRAVLFGGSGPGGKLRDVLAYDPAGDQLSVLPARLPEARYAMGAAWDGSAAYLFGGADAQEDSVGDVWAFDGSGVRPMPATLPSTRMNVAAAWTQQGALLLGGIHSQDGSYLDDVLRYDTLHPEAPLGFLARAGPGLHEITLTWQAAPHAAADGVAAYRLYRGAAPGAEQPLTELGPDARSYRDVGLDPLTTYYYRVTAATASAESPPSHEDCTRPWPAHLLPSTDAPCALPEGWRERVLADVALPLDPLPGAALLTVDAGPDPGAPDVYRVDASVGGQALPTVRVYTAGAPLPPVHLTVPAPTGGVRARVALREDPSEILCVLQVDQYCALRAPAARSDWLLGPGSKAELVVHATGTADGAGADAWARVPLAGELAGLRG